LRCLYGFDEFHGVFLSVFDKRLKYNSEATAEVNRVTESIGVNDGGGSYLDLHTGQTGFGRKVDDLTMATFLKRYGVTDHQVSMLPLSLDSSVSRMSEEVIARGEQCNICSEHSKKSCGKCTKIHYCSPDCQRKAWPIHNIFCQVKGPADDGISSAEKRSVDALFLAQDEATPQLIRLPLVWKDGKDHEGGFWSTDTSMFIHGVVGIFRSDFFPGAAGLHLTSAYHVFYKDDFLRDVGSKENCCLRALVGAVAKSVYGNQRNLPKGSKTLNRGPPLHFQGNLLVVKREKNDGPYLGSTSEGKHRNVRLEDAHEIATLLYKVNIAYVSS
jgi:hypothetical protein